MFTLRRLPRTLNTFMHTSLEKGQFIKRMKFLFSRILLIRIKVIQMRPITTVNFITNESLDKISNKIYRSNRPHLNHFNLY